MDIPSDCSIRVSVAVVGKATVHKRVIITDNGSALSHGYVFRILKAVAPCVAYRSYLFAIDFSHPCVASVFNPKKVMYSGNCHNAIDVGGKAGDMYGQNSTC